MRILVTNDDGIHAEGIQALYKALDKIADVFVIAPERERSAVGHGITMHKPLFVKEINSSSDHIKIWSANGTPSDCVKLGVEAMKDIKPDIIMSGINAGANLGIDILYSGTASAAIEGMILGIPSVAISLATYDHPDFTLAAQFSVNLAKKMVEQPLPEGTFLNVNIPPDADLDFNRVAITTLGKRRYTNYFDKRTDPRGRTYYWLSGDVIEYNEGKETDTGAVKQKYISITPVRFDFNDKDTAAVIKKWYE